MNGQATDTKTGTVTTFVNCARIDNLPTHYFTFELILDPRPAPPTPPKTQVFYADPARTNIRNIIAVVASAWENGDRIEVVTSASPVRVLAANRIPG